MSANSLCKEKTSIRRILPKEKSAIVSTILFSLIFSLSFIPFFRCINADFSLAAVALIVGGGLAFVAVNWLTCFIDKRRIGISAPAKPMNIKNALGVYLLFIVLWGFVFLVFFPGCASTDSNDIFKIIFGLDFTGNHFRYDTINNHHPAFYIFINWLIIAIAQCCGADTTVAISFVALFHLLFLAWCCVHACRRVYNLTGNRALLVVMTLFFLVNPLVILYSITIWKDILFSGCVLVLGAEILSLSVDTETYMRKRSNLVMLAISLMFCALLRSNGLLVAVATTVVIVAVFKNYRKALLCTGCCALAIAAIVLGPVFTLVGVVPGHFSEAISVPLQQIGLVVKEGGQIDDNDKDFLNNVLPIDEMKKLYRGGSPNSIKFATDFNDEFLESHKIEFFATYLSVGIKNPLVYFDAWTRQTKSFWCIGAGAGTSYTYASGYNLGDGKVSQNLLSPVVSYDLVRKILNFPLHWYNPLYNIGITVWLMLFCLFYNVRKGRIKQSLCLTPIFFVWATLLIAAPATDFRYVFALHLSIPLIVLSVFISKRNELNLTDNSGN